MNTKSSHIFLVLLLVAPLYPAILTEDLQVVIPTGQPSPVERLAHTTTPLPALIFRWDDSGSSIVYMQDHFTLMMNNSHPQKELEMERLRQQLNLNFDTDLKFRHKSISIKVVLE